MKSNGSKRGCETALKWERKDDERDDRKIKVQRKRKAITQSKVIRSTEKEEDIKIGKQGGQTQQNRKRKQICERNDTEIKTNDEQKMVSFFSRR